MALKMNYKIIRHFAGNHDVSSFVGKTWTPTVNASSVFLERYFQTLVYGTWIVPKKYEGGEVPILEKEFD